VCVLADELSECELAGVRFEYGLADVEVQNEPADEAVLNVLVLVDGAAATDNAVAVIEVNQYLFEQLVF
jgi:hypothetical protein